MKTSLLIVLIALLSAGCKANKGTTVVTSESIGGIELTLTRNYTASELIIGRRICSALKNKRELFEKVANMQEKFRFKGETKACDNPNPFNKLEFSASISNASSTDYEYVATTSYKPNYFKDVLTDQNGAMRLLCDNLSKSDEVSNTSMSGSSYLLVSFLISEGYDRFDVLKSSTDSAGNFTLLSAESVSVITQKTQADEKFFGVEKIRIRNVSCPNSKDFSSLKQTWVSALTSF